MLQVLYPTWNMGYKELRKHYFRKNVRRGGLLSLIGTQIFFIHIFIVNMWTEGNKLRPFSSWVYEAKAKGGAVCASELYFTFFDKVNIITCESITFVNMYRLTVPILRWGSNFFIHISIINMCAENPVLLRFSGGVYEAKAKTRRWGSGAHDILPLWKK